MSKDLSMIQMLLIDLLKKSEVDIEVAKVIMLTLKEDEFSMEELILWISDNKPTEQQIMKDWIEPYLSKNSHETNKKTDQGTST